VTGKEASINFSQSKGSDNTKAHITLADIKGSPQSLQSNGIAGEVSIKEGDRSVHGKFSSPLSGNLEKMIFDLPKVRRPN
jgi:AsmA protein